MADTAVRKNTHILPVSCLITLIVIAFAADCLASGIYSYQDEKGTWHFTNVPSDPRYSARETGHMSRKTRKRKKRHLKYRRPAFSKQISHKKLLPIINSTANRYNLDPELIKAVIKVESNCMVNARSSRGAMGLMQLMPSTARKLGIKDPFDPVENIKGGSLYLRTMLETFNGDLLRALAAYNAGPAAVQRYNGIPPYPETIQYVEKVLNEWYRNLKGAK